jgi:hypothetical protein
MNSIKRLGVNTKCIPTSFMQRRPGHLYIYSVEKSSGVTVENMYPGYLIKMTRTHLIGIGMDLHSNKMAVEYFTEIESYSNKIISCN